MQTRRNWDRQDPTHWLALLRAIRSSLRTALQLPVGDSGWQAFTRWYAKVTSSSSSRLERTFCCSPFVSWTAVVAKQARLRAIECSKKQSEQLMVARGRKRWTQAACSSPQYVRPRRNVARSPTKTPLPSDPRPACPNQHDVQNAKRRTSPNFLPPSRTVRLQGLDIHHLLIVRLLHSHSIARRCPHLDSLHLRQLCRTLNCSVLFPFASAATKRTWTSRRPSLASPPSRAFRSPIHLDRLPTCRLSLRPSHLAIVRSSSNLVCPRTFKHARSLLARLLFRWYSFLTLLLLRLAGSAVGEGTIRLERRKTEGDPRRMKEAGDVVL